MTDDSLQGRAHSLLTKITPGPWYVEEDTNDLLGEYIGRVKRSGCYCGTGDPNDLWCEGHEPEKRVFHVEGPEFINVDDLGYYYTESDAEFIAAAPQLVRDLLTELHTITAQVQALTQEREAYLKLASRLRHEDTTFTVPVVPPGTLEHMKVTLSTAPGDGVNWQARAEHAEAEAAALRTALEQLDVDALVLEAFEDYKRHRSILSYSGGQAVLAALRLGITTAQCAVKKATLTPVSAVPSGEP